MRIFVILLTCLLFISSCNQPPADEKAAPSVSSTIPPIDGNAIKGHIEKLASDEMEGRAPGGKGEELATTYIADFYKSIGLKTQFQDVPLVGVTATVSPMKFAGKTGNKTLKYKDEFVAWSRREEDTVTID